MLAAGAAAGAHDTDSRVGLPSVCVLVMPHSCLRVKGQLAKAAAALVLDSLTTSLGGHLAARPTHLLHLPQQLAQQAATF